MSNYIFEVIEIGIQPVIHDSDIDLLICKNECGKVIYIDVLGVIGFEITTKYVILKRERMEQNQSSIVQVMKRA